MFEIAFTLSSRWRSARKLSAKLTEGVLTRNETPGPARSDRVGQNIHDSECDKKRAKANTGDLAQQNAGRQLTQSSRVSFEHAVEYFVSYFDYYSRKLTFRGQTRSLRRIRA